MKLTTLLALAVTLTTAAFVQTARASDVPDNMLSLRPVAAASQVPVANNSYQYDLITMQIVQNGAVVAEQKLYRSSVMIFNVDFGKARDTRVRAVLEGRILDEVQVSEGVRLVDYTNRFDLRY